MLVIGKGLIKSKPHDASHLTPEPRLIYSRCSIVTERMNHIFYIKFQKLFKSLPKENSSMEAKLLSLRRQYTRNFENTSAKQMTCYSRKISIITKQNVREIPD